ncbi:X-Pro dipeptidyl-peptidase-domain-containing protein [Podospora appendiculata]|uniref:X-Pro dipeptidyl-peptidase-domain-containing protein n=1 Tax=Podospora appendiculata TaxID=314037 RepID=A0AAE0X1Z9_9PEZI|nr:X-Pro dipeptidyl-peptidase-domain-containing protein [Podospora appendiculata]
MAPVKRSTLNALVDRLFAWTNALPPESTSYTIDHVKIPIGLGDARIHLAADLYQPTGSPVGTLLVRTPYGISGTFALGNARIFAARGYQVVLSSCRGTGESEGSLDPGRDETADGHAIVSWMRAQPWYTGSFATVGGSYCGFVQYALLTGDDAPPPQDMKAAVVATGPHDLAKFVSGTGAMSSQIIVWAELLTRMRRGDSTLSTIFHLLTQAAKLRTVVDAAPLTDSVNKYFDNQTPPWLRQFITHPDPTDPYYNPLRLDDALQRATIPIALITGWHDLMLPQVMEQYTTLTARGCPVSLTIGPWTHLAAQRNTFPLTLAWLDTHLAQTKPAPSNPPVRIYITGSNPSWVTLPTWPPPTTQQTLFLSPHTLSSSPPTTPVPPSIFTFNPKSPTPSVGVATLFDSGVRRTPDTSLAARADVLTFTTAPLPSDLEVCGQPLVTLYHSSSHPFVDVLVLLSEVNPSGASYSVSERFVRLDASSSRGEEGRILELVLHDCAHRFRRGSRVRLLVAGGSHPRYIRNLGTGENPGTGRGMREAVHTVRHEVGAVSKVVLPVCLRSWR